MNDYIEIRFKKCITKNFPFFDSIYGLGIWLRQGFDPHVHVEIYFPFNGWSYSSSEDDNGERFKRIGYSNIDSWDCIKVDLNDMIFKTDLDLFHHIASTRLKNNEDTKLFFNPEVMIVKCKDLYDWVAIGLKEGLPLGIQDPKKRYCSEAVTIEMSWLKWFRGKTINVADLYKFVKDKVWLKVK